jgi:hypothetical protein
MITWDRWGRGFWRSQCGRFDVFGHSQGWTAIDWDLGTTRVFATEKLAREWCEFRTQLEAVCVNMGVKVT